MILVKIKTAMICVSAVLKEKLTVFWLNEIEKEVNIEVDCSDCAESHSC